VNRKRLGYIFIGGGIFMALIVGVIVYGQVADAERVKASLPKARVVIATTDIPARTEIAAAMVNVRTVPDELVQAGAATKIEDVVGKFTPNPILKGEVVNTSRIGPVAAKNAPSFKIEKGKVMYVMPVDFGGAGKPFAIAQVNALRAGDRVDLLYSTINVPQGLNAEQREEYLANPIPYLQTRIMLQDLRIQEIGTYAPDGSLIPASGEASSKDQVQGSLADAKIILIVTPEEALVLKWLKDAATYYNRASNVEMVLRSPADEEKADPNLVVNFNYMREKYNLVPPPPPGVTASGR
jgi:Flp pilus assembly protein CpaB